LPGARVSLTYFDIAYDNQVANYLSNLNVLFSESLLAGTPVIQRNPSAALVASLIATYPVNAGPLPATWTLFVDGRNLNLGKSVTNGIDIDLSYKIPTDQHGNFSVGLFGSYLTKYASAISASAPLLDQLNTINNPLRFRARGNLGWSMGGWSATAFLNYTNGYTNNATTTIQEVSSQTTVDSHLAYNFGDASASPLLRNLRIGLDVSNLFDSLPPFVNVASSNNAPGGFDPTVGNPFGRRLSLSIDKRL
jgi:iron complex outermembrane receptor protein